MSANDFLFQPGSAGAVNAVPVLVATEIWDWVSVQLSGTFSATAAFEGSNDGQNWQPVVLQRSDNPSTLVTTGNAAGLWHGPCPYRHFRVRCSAYTSGTMVVSALFSAEEISALAPSNQGVSAVSGVSTAGGKTFQYKAVDNAAAAGDLTIQAASAGNKAKLISYLIVPNAACTVQWKRGATPLSGPMLLNAGAEYDAAGHLLAPLMETAVNEALILNVSTAVQVSGHCAYLLEP